MKLRIPSLLSCLAALALAASCAGDDKKATTDEAAAGGGGEPPSSGGSSAIQGGTGGAGPAAGGSGGRGSTAGSGGGSSGSGGSGGTVTGSGGDGEPTGAGAPNGSAGEGNQPGGPVSVCGAGNYDAGTTGCMTCPAPPAPGSSKAIDCDDFDSAERDGDGNLLLRLSGLAIHEPFGGEIGMDWSENGAPGSATVAWELSSAPASFVFHLPVEARYADAITIGSWTFTDACGFTFTTSAFRVYWDGQESWQCGQGT